MGDCYIVGAAPFEEHFTPKKEDLVIAADGGHLALARMGIQAHLVVGDFDSSAPPEGVTVLRHPPEKDDTDTALAIEEGIARGYRTFLLYGCMGGRPDHTFGAIQTLLGLTRRGFSGYLFGEGMLGTVLIDGTISFASVGTVSVFALSERAEGVTLTGLKYPLQNVTLTNDYPLGVSNEGNGSPATISVGKGALYILWEQNGSMYLPKRH